MNISNIITNVIVPLVLIIITAIIIITLILMIIKDDIKKEDKKIKKEEEKNNKYANIDTSIIYKEIDLSKIKDANILKDNVFEMFKSILKALSNMDIKTLENLTSKTLYNTYLEKINKLKKDGELNIIKNVTLNDIRILDIKKKKNDYNIKFYININCYNYNVEKRKKRTTKGYDDRKINQEFLLYLDKIEDKCIISKIVKVGQKTLNKEKKIKKKKK